jgi:hypothetical protein
MMERIEMNGTFGFVYCGAAGVGIGVFTVSGVTLKGTDASGVHYRGSVVEQADGRLLVDMKMTVPVGVCLVQGTSPQEVPHERHFRHVFPAHFGDGEPIRLEGQPGPLNLMIRRVTDEWATAIEGSRFQLGPTAAAA